MGRIRFIPLILVSFLLLAFSGVAEAQVTSAAFDPNCYFPRIGVPGEIDTIYGAHDLQYFGSGMLNIGPSDENSYGRMSCVFDHNNGTKIVSDSIFSTGSFFNLHKLNIKGVFNINRNIVRFGHFRSPKFKDILTIDNSSPPRIYWQDSLGNYDTSRYTDLTPSIKGKLNNGYSFMQPYSAHLISDSVDDIIYEVQVINSITVHDSFYMVLYKGGGNLFEQGKIAHEDSSIYYKEDGYSISTTTQGDYRGTGREDLIVSDYGAAGQHNRRGNFLYFKNEPPFTMSNFVHAIRYDTLFAQWQSRNTLNDGSWGFSMKAFRKQPGDSSDDFLSYFITNYGSLSAVQEYLIFKGGKDFGSHRWTADSAAFVLHEPYYYDSKFIGLSFGGGIHDCGDMTGTGNRVLYIEGLGDGGFYAYEYFYVLGDAMDDKVDMLIGPIDNDGGAGSSVDTLVADKDKYQDILMGESGYSFEGGNHIVGSIYLVHGSEKIPVKTRNVASTSETVFNISVYPNPVTSGKCTLDLSSMPQQDLHIRFFDLLGRAIYDENLYAPFMRSKHQMLLNSLSSGSYILEVTGKDFTARLQIQVLH